MNSFVNKNSYVYIHVCIHIGIESSGKLETGYLNGVDLNLCAKGCVLWVRRKVHYGTPTWNPYNNQ